MGPPGLVLFLSSISKSHEHLFIHVRSGMCQSRHGVKGQPAGVRSRLPIWALGITQVLRLSWVISPGTWLLLQCSVCISLQGPKLLAPLHERAAHGGHQGSCLYCSRAVTKDRKSSFYLPWALCPALESVPFGTDMLNQFREAAFCDEGC